MTKIKRRYRIVPLHQGNYEAELTALMDKAMVAQRAEAAADDEGAPESGPPLRAGQKAAVPAKKMSLEYARQHDELLAEAEETAEMVPVWAIAHDEWSRLADDHPPRDDVPEDKEGGVPAKTFPEDRQRGVNSKTFPPLLLRAALVDPDDDVEDLEHRIAKGGKILAELGLSRIQYVKLETAAWNVNVGDDSLPKLSLVSFLTEGTDSDSKRQSDSE